MSYFIHRLSTGLSFKPDKASIHPGINLLILFIQFIFLVFQLSDIKTIFLLSLFLLFVVIELIYTKNFLNSINLIRGILPLLIITFVITIFFGGPLRAVLLILRIATGALAFSIFIISTNPSDLSKFLEKLYIPHKIAIIPSLSLSLIPRTLKDIEETYNTLLLRDEIKGSFLRWLPKLLSISISSAVYRSNFIEESLYIKGFTSNSRKRLGTNHKISKYDLIRVFYWFMAFFMLTYSIVLFKTVN